MRPEKIGRVGEDIVAGLLGYRRQPASGARWPLKEDLVKIGPGDLKNIAQVKTTTSLKMIEQFVELAEYAAVEEASASWYEVYLGPGRAWVFAKCLVDIVPLGAGAVGTVRKHGARTRTKDNRVYEKKTNSRRRDGTT